MAGKVLHSYFALVANKVKLVNMANEKNKKRLPSVNLSEGKDYVSSFVNELIYGAKEVDRKNARN